jgi:mono/diheme cytochrome c family protein
MQRRAVWRRFGVALILGLLTVTGARTLRAQEADGKKVFTTICAACHQQSGEGVEAMFPPLAGSEWATGDEAKLVRIILQGLIGPIEVAGEPFAGAMPGWADMLKDAEVAAVATYIRNSWGNKAAPVTAATVTEIRKATTTRKTPWTAADLAQVPATVKK